MCGHHYGWRSIDLVIVSFLICYSISQNNFLSSSHFLRKQWFNRKDREYCTQREKNRKFYLALSTLTQPQGTKRKPKKREALYVPFRFHNYPQSGKLQGKEKGFSVSQVDRRPGKQVVIIIARWMVKVVYRKS